MLTQVSICAIRLSVNGADSDLRRNDIFKS